MLSLYNLIHTFIYNGCFFRVSLVYVLFELVISVFYQLFSKTKDLVHSK